MLILKCFRSSSLSAFCKIGVLKTSAKFLGKHICRSLFSKSCGPISLKFKIKDCITDIFDIFNEFCRNVKNTFLQDSSRRLPLIFRKPDIFKHLILSKFVHSINIVRTLYLMRRNVNFTGLPFYSRVIIRTIFSLKNLV